MTTKSKIPDNVKIPTEEELPTATVIKELDGYIDAVCLFLSRESLMEVLYSFKPELFK